MDRTLSGKRIKLIRMEDPYTNLKEGDEGSIKFIDGIGQIHVRWDNGSTLAIVPEIDEYEIENENLSKNKLRHVRLFEEFINGSDLGYMNVKMEEISDLIDSSDDETIIFNWKIANNELNATLKIDISDYIFSFNLETMSLIRVVNGDKTVDRVSSSEEAMDIIEKSIYDHLDISESIRNKGGI